jgi:hypothetical protein
MASTFENKLDELTGRNAVKIYQYYVAGSVDYTAQLERIKSSGVKSVYLCGDFEDIGCILEAAENMNLQVLFLGDSTWGTEEFLPVAGEHAYKNVAFTNLYTEEEVITQLYICRDQSTTLYLKNIQPADNNTAIYEWTETNGYLSMKVSADTKSAEIKAVAKGSTKIQVKDEKGATFTLNVKVLIPATSILINSKQRPTDIVINKGASAATITASLTPTNTDDMLTWTTDKEDIIKVAQVGVSGPTQKILVTGLKAGTSSTAVYRHAKAPVKVSNGDTIVYEIRVYNEADIDAMPVDPDTIDIGFTGPLYSIDGSVTVTDPNNNEVASGNNILEIQSVFILIFFIFAI